MNGWKELYDIYLPMKRFYGLTMSFHDGKDEVWIKIVKNDKAIIKCSGEELEDVLISTIRELEWWERNRKDMRK